MAGYVYPMHQLLVVRPMSVTALYVPLVRLLRVKTVSYIVSKWHILKMQRSMAYNYLALANSHFPHSTARARCQGWPQESCSWSP